MAVPRSEVLVEQFFNLASVLAQSPPIPVDFVGPILQIGTTLVLVGIIYGVMKTKVDGQEQRIAELEESIKNLGDGKRLDKLEENVEKTREMMVLIVRQEERYSAMDARISTQGQRMDAHATTTANIISSQASLVNSRLEAINNIVSGHTTQLVSLLQRSRLRTDSGGGAA